MGCLHSKTASSTASSNTSSTASSNTSITTSSTTSITTGSTRSSFAVQTSHLKVALTILLVLIMLLPVIASQ